MSTDLSQRYGTARPGQRRLLLVVAAVVAVAFLGWVVWAAWINATPEVRSTLRGFAVSGDHAATAFVEVTLDGDVEATCRVRALAEDHTVVGEISFTPVDGSNDVELRTERKATSVELVGCTSEGQKRPR